MSLFREEAKYSDPIKCDRCYDIKIAREMSVIEMLKMSDEICLMRHMIIMMRLEISESTSQRYGTDYMRSTRLMTKGESCKLKSRRSYKIDSSSTTDTRSQGSQQIFWRTICSKSSERIALVSSRHYEVSLDLAHIDKSMGK